MSTPAKGPPWFKYMPLWWFLGILATAVGVHLVCFAEYQTKNDAMRGMGRGMFIGIPGALLLLVLSLRALFRHILNESKRSASSKGRQT
ncbi:MAG: hypothetical protein QNJ98_18830 [Planctomycetota bacterium]|nr:hypothetical protein [Planctomycetota bacterium]